MSVHANAARRLTTRHGADHPAKHATRDRGRDHIPRPWADQSGFQAGAKAKPLSGISAQHPDQAGGAQRAHGDKRSLRTHDLQVTAVFLQPARALHEAPGLFHTTHRRRRKHRQRCYWRPARPVRYPRPDAVMSRARIGGAMAHELSAGLPPSSTAPLSRSVAASFFGALPTCTHSELVLRHLPHTTGRSRAAARRQSRLGLPPRQRREEARFAPKDR